MQLPPAWGIEVPVFLALVLLPMSLIGALSGLVIGAIAQAITVEVRGLKKVLVGVLATTIAFVVVGVGTGGEIGGIFFVADLLCGAAAGAIFAGLDRNPA